MTPWPLARAAFLLATCLVGPASAGNVANGQALATNWCARCHNLAPGYPALLSPTSFASIAANRSEEQIRSGIQFNPMHTSLKRGTFTLGMIEIDDLTAYILSFSTP
jgi:mono/diheme cytochrome c family protein